MRRDRAQQVHAHRHELLSLQLGGVRPVAADIRSTARDVPGLVQISVHIRRVFLRVTRPRLGDVDERVGPHDRRVHRRAILGDLPSVPLADLIKPVSRGQADPHDLADSPGVRATASSAVRRGQLQRASRYGDVHGQENPPQALLRAVHLPVLRSTNVPHHVSLRIDRPEAPQVEHDASRQNRVDKELQASSRKIVQESVENAE